MIDVGVLSPVTGGFYFGEVLSGVVSRVQASGGRVTVVQTLDAGNTGDEFVPAPETGIPVGWDQFDGVLSIAWAAGRPFLQQLRSTGVPMVLLSSDLDIGVPTVVADNVVCVRGLVRHLVHDHGHRRLVFVGNVHQSDMRERHEAYCAELASLGTTAHDVGLVATPDHVERGGRAVAGAVAEAVRAGGVTAVVTATDRVALGLMAGLAERGVRVPQDVAVIGFDDVDTGWHHDPPLATVHQDFAGLGDFAAGLLLEEAAGHGGPPRQHVVESVFVPRRSCGCGASVAGPAAQAEEDGLALAVEVERLAGDGTAVVDADALDGVVSTHVSRLVHRGMSPEVVERFTHALVTRLGRERPRAPTGEGTALCAEAIVRATLALSRAQGEENLRRTARLSRSLMEQHDVGIGLLDRVGSAPSDLHWLSAVSTRLGCLGLWETEPGGDLQVAGVYDPDGHLAERLPTRLRPQCFPPRALMDQVGAGEVAYVIPVRGASGDHGLLTVVGAVDTEYGTGRTTHNSWAALLGVALRQRRLVADLRRSEERYSLATAATHDGLWDWDVAGAECFYSERCRELLGSDVDRAHDPRPSPDRTVAPELAPWGVAVHPEDRDGLCAALHRAVTDLEPVELELRVRPGADGPYRWMLCRAVPDGPAGGPARRVVGALSDIDQRKELEEQLRQAALYDEVTGLPNRRLFLDRLTWALHQSRRSDEASFAVVFLDLDGFKLINDSLGHLRGDELLRVVGERLQQDLRSVDTAARFGGDEFAVLLYGLRHETVLGIARRIQERICAPVLLGDHEVSVSASVGITTSDAAYADAEEVLRDADIAMYHAKDAERGSASVFDPAMHQRATARLQAESELREALRSEQFTIRYQPIIALEQDAPIEHVEALVRWEHPRRGLLLPEEFLPMLAEDGAVVQLGRWVLDTVCRARARWRAEGVTRMSVSVNLSARELWSPSLLTSVLQALDRHEVPPHELVLEVAEGTVMADPATATRTMAELREVGVRWMVDDFGTGQSSLEVLRTVPAEAIKVDHSFVRSLGEDPRTAALVRIMAQTGRALGLGIVGEGVETAAQAKALAQAGCTAVQGWLYSRAVPDSEVPGLVPTRSWHGRGSTARP
ncbi:EAL domain-containing protein [Cellulomonas bogoriensis]|uniref:Diguanylate cyclase n=1 Tax=Cellulomonas bogoriensis 69B4 = DSM 16987 TaxID=1386082 RepID=A0A0A0BR31_9CELL|nr:EAL domain-containing protein [Cellulomonas bogoriensis]KGM10426.1 diguanylate cyclase [Cellulomonas bogoriensis 69B4 = DSM 16987]